MRQRTRSIPQSESIVPKPGGRPPRAAGRAADRPHRGQPIALAQQRVGGSVGRHDPSAPVEADGTRGDAVEGFDRRGVRGPCACRRLPQPHEPDTIARPVSSRTRTPGNWTACARPAFSLRGAGIRHPSFPTGNAFSIRQIIYQTENSGIGNWASETLPGPPSRRYIPTRHSIRRKRDWSFRLRPISDWLRRHPGNPDRRPGPAPRMSGGVRPADAAARRRRRAAGSAEGRLRITRSRAGIGIDASPSVGGLSAYMIRKSI